MRRGAAAAGVCADPEERSALAAAAEAANLQVRAAAIVQPCTSTTLRTKNALEAKATHAASDCW
eukprot:scaffold153468_cov23-Prasinocladus_malaysianus.AAC.1